MWVCLSSGYISRQMLMVDILRQMLMVNSSYQMLDKTWFNFSRFTFFCRISIMILLFGRRLSRRPPPGLESCLGHTAGPGRRAAVVSSLSGWGDPIRRSPSLDRNLPELESHVRGMPLHSVEEELSWSRRSLWNHLVGDRRLLRGLPRSGLLPPGLGRSSWRGADTPGPGSKRPGGSAKGGEWCELGFWRGRRYGQAKSTQRLESPVGDLRPLPRTTRHIAWRLPARTPP